MAQICALAPVLFEIEASARAMVRTPTGASVDRLERALVALEAQRLTLGDGVMVEAAIERFLSSRTSLALTYRGSGTAAMLAQANTPGFAAIAGEMKAIVSHSPCAIVVSTGQDGIPQEPGTNASSSGPEGEQPNHAKDDPKTGHRVPLDAIGIAPFKNPASVFAMAVVAAIFAAMAFLAVRRNRRSYTRYICFLPAELVIGRTSIATHLIEISQSGAKISITDPMEAGMTVSLSIDDVDHEASVVWANDSCAGVQFSEVMPQQRLADMLGQNGGGYERQPLLA